jgi:hypothetical protein
LQQLVEQSTKKPEGRRFTAELLKLSFVLHALSPVTYRLLRRFLPLASEETIRTSFLSESSQMHIDLVSGEHLVERLLEWRSDRDPSERIKVVLGVDAANCTKIGLVGEKKHARESTPTWCRLIPTCGACSYESR